MITFDRNDIQIIFDVPPKMLPDDKVAIDSEFFGMDKKKLHRPGGTFASLGCTADGRTVYMIFNERQVQEFYNQIEPAVHIYHNMVFDIRQLRRYADIPDRKKIWDTMFIEQIMYRGYYDDFGLNDLARRYLSVYLPKEERRSFSDGNKMTDEQIFYAACDIVATWQVQQVQKKFVDDTDYNLWKKVELPNIWSLLRFQGALVDQQKWLSIAEEKADTASTIWNELSEELGINIRSNEQLKEYLQSIGLKKLKDVTADTLEGYADKYPVVQRVLDFRKPNKGASTYGKKWLTENVEEDGRVYSSFNPIGAVTGRYSSSNPNLQNIPVRKDPIYRECFIAAPGHRLIIADWAAQEPRIAAYLSQDKELWDIFSSDKDPYIVIGKLILGVDFDKSDKRRDDMKSTFLGLCYGMTPIGLAEKLDVSEAEASELEDAFFERFPSLQEYTKDSVNSAFRNGHVQTIMGRKIWTNTYQGRVNQVSPNYRIQGTAGDEIKLSSAGIYQYWYPKYGYNPILFPVHDELVLEVEEENVAEGRELLERVMVDVAEAMHPGVPSKADIHVGNRWSDKKEPKKVG